MGTITRSFANLITATGIGGKFESALLHVRDEKSAGTSGGTAVTGSFQTRVLNTQLTNEISGASLASNQITLPAGTYYIHASQPGYRTEEFKVKLRNITDSSDTLIGSSTYHNPTNGVAGYAFVTGRFTIAAQKDFAIQYRAQGTAAANDLGVTSNFGVVEVFTDVQIWKVA